MAMDLFIVLFNTKEHVTTVHARHYNKSFVNDDSCKGTEKNTDVQNEPKTVTRNTADCE